MSTSGAKRALLLAFALISMLIFTALGVWQVERRAWKLALIARVEQRLHAPPTVAPGLSAWPKITREHDEYRKVITRGGFRHDAETLVQAVTERGPGYWIITPLVTSADTILVNRGFVPTERRAAATRRAGQVTGPVAITGLLRVTEPGGGFLRSNDSQAGRWYSRDVAAIARARGITNAAPYFIDAAATPNPGGWPVGGLTVVAFHNSHLVYALTWFALACLSAWGAWLVWSRR